MLGPFCFPSSERESHMPKPHGWYSQNLNPGLSDYAQFLGQSDQEPGIPGWVADHPSPPNLNPLRSALLSRLRVRSPRLDLASEEQVRSKDSQCAPIAGQGKTASAELSAPDLMAEEAFAARHFMQEGGAPPAPRHPPCTSWSSVTSPVLCWHSATPLEAHSWRNEAGTQE